MTTYETLLIKEIESEINKVSNIYYDSHIDRIKKIIESLLEQKPKTTLKNLSDIY